MIKINEELKKLIPPLQPEEYAQLEKSIISEGCRDAIIIWQGVIIDGHNRYEICQKNTIGYNVTEKEFNNIDDVKVWMIDNQKGRRNLSDGWMWELAQAKKQLLAEKGRENMSAGGGDKKTGLSTIDKPDIQPINTRNEVAKDLGWSTGKVAMADKVWKEARLEVKEAIKSGELSINEAYQDIKKQKNIEERRTKEIQQAKESIKQIAIIKKMPAMEFLQTVKAVDLLITDPPYFTDGNFVEEVSFALSKVKDSGQAYVFAGAYPEEINAYINMDTHHMELSQMLVWNYNNTGQRQPNERYTSNYQVCFYYRGVNSAPINKPADGKEQYACQTINAPDGRLGDRFHKWQKPNELIQRLIKNSSNEGDLIIDPFAGSGSTLINASILGRIAIGCDIDEDAISICVERGCNYEV